jgi:hypothetical protein
MNTNQFARLNSFFRNHPVWRWIAAVLIILFSTYTILVPLIAQWKIEKWMKENGEDRVKVESVTFNPFIMKLRIHSLFAEGFQMGKVGWKRMAFELDLWPLHRQRVVINDFDLRDALITVQQNRRGNWVIGGIPFKTGSGRNYGGGGKKGWDFGLSNVALSNVQILYREPGLNQKILIREAVVDTFRSWENEKKSRFSIQAMISGGEVTISGRIDPQGGERSFASEVHVASLPLQWLSPILKNSGHSGIDGVLNADFKAQGSLRSQNRYNFNATGKGELNSIFTGITGFPYTIDVSRIAYEGAFHSNDSAMIQLSDKIRVINMTIRDTLSHVLVLRLDTGTMGNITAANMSISTEITRLEGVKTFANTDSSGLQNSRPFAMEASVIDISEFSFTRNRPEIFVGSVVLQALNASLVREKNGAFRISKQLPMAPPKKKKQQPESKPPLVSIKKFIIDGQSQIELIDLTIDPEVTIQTTDLRFKLIDLYSSEEKGPGSYNLTATILPQATLKVNGTIGQIFPRPDLTVQSQFENFNLPQLSSYMLNLFGYEIDSGKVDGITSGNVKKGRLDLESQIKINNLEISAVPSQSSYEKYKNAFMGMSLESALSIITDKNGDVNLSIPVNGNLSDPKFNFTDVLRAAIVNSISRGLNAVYYDSLR